MDCLVDALNLLGSTLINLAEAISNSASFTLPSDNKPPKQSALAEKILESIKPILGVFNKGFLVTEEGLKIKVLTWDLERRKPANGSKVSGIPTKRLDAIHPGTLICLT